METIPVTQLSALAHDGRLSLIRLLLRRYPDWVAAGTLASSLAFKPSTASVHLSTLRQAGLVAQRRDGRSLLYRADVDAMGDLIRFLTDECCRGRAPCLPNPSCSTRPHMTDQKFKTLFICTGNSARSIFAETLLRAEAGDRFDAYSAGFQPKSELNPFAVEMLKNKGHDISPLRSKHVSEYQGDDAPGFDFVFTVCDQAANEECPAWPGQPVNGHWSIPDPVKAEGTEAEKRLAFQEAYMRLRNRISAFTSLPLESLDRASLQKAVDDIAEGIDAKDTA